MSRPNEDAPAEGELNSLQTHILTEDVDPHLTVMQIATAEPGTQIDLELKTEAGTIRALLTTVKDNRAPHMIDPYDMNW